MYIQINPNGAGQPKNIDKKHRANGDKQSKRSLDAPVEYPVKQGYKTNAKPSHEDVGNEHSPIVEARLRHQVLPAVRTALLHVKRPFESKSRRTKHIRFVAFGAFEVENTVSFAAFSENSHLVFFEQI